MSKPEQIPNIKNQLRSKQIGTPKSPEERKSEANIRKNEAWQDLQKIPTQVAQNVVKLFGKISGKVPQITTSQISQKIGSNEIKSTTDFGKAEISNPQIEAKKVEEILIQPLITLREPTTQELALIRLKYQKLPSKRPEFSKYLNEINDSGTLRKVGEVTKYGGIGEETKNRTLLAGEIKNVREEIRKRNNAEQENLQTDREYLQEEKLGELNKLEKIRSWAWDLQRQINELSENKLSRLLYRARIAKLEQQKRALFEKYGSMEEIGQKIIGLNTAKHQREFTYSQNLAILEKPSPRNPKEILEKYYEKKIKDLIKNNNSSVKNILDSITVNIKTDFEYGGFHINIGDFLPVTYREGDWSVPGNSNVVNTFRDKSNNSKYYQDSAVVHFMPLGFRENIGTERANEALFILILGIKKLINLYKTNSKLFNNVEKIIGITNAIFAKNIKSLGFQEIFILDQDISKNDGKIPNVGLEIQISKMLEQESRIDKLLQKLSKSFIGNVEFRTTKN